MHVLYVYSSFHLFILVGLQQTKSYHLLHLFSLVMFLCEVVLCYSSVNFVSSYKVIFSEIYLKALVFLCAFEESVDCALLFLLR